MVTFHNQRDYIFVRLHRYMFAEGKGEGKEKKTRARLQVRGLALVHVFSRCHIVVLLLLLPLLCCVLSCMACFFSSGFLFSPLLASDNSVAF